MSLIDRYVLREWLKVFALAVLVTLGILLLEDMQDDVPDLRAYGAHAVDILRYYALLTPSFIPTIVPIALLVSVLFVLSQFHRNNEIIAMRASGMSLFRITRTLWAGGLVLSLALVYFNADIAPRAFEASRTLRDSMRFSKEVERSGDKAAGLIFNPTFDNHRDHRLWFMNRFSEYTYRGFGISVHERDEEGHELRRVYAREGFYEDGRWVFLEGQEMEFEAGTLETPKRVLKFERRVFEDFTEDPALMKTLSKEPDDLSYLELGRLLAQVPPEESPAMHPYAVRYHSILATPFSCLIVIGIAVPFAVGGVRTNPLVGVSKAVVLFFAYFVLSSMAGILGSQDIMPYAAAAWLPNIVMLALAAVLFRRVV